MKVWFSSFLVKVCLALSCALGILCPQVASCDDSFSLTRPIFDDFFVLEHQFRAAKTTSLDIRFHRLFHLSLGQVLEGSLEKASVNLNLLKSLARKQGYENLPDFSFNLLRQAQQAFAEQNAERSEFFVTKAVELSPTDARVLFVAASLHEVVGKGQAFGLFLSSVGHVWRRPILLATIALNGSLVFLTAFTLALLLVIVVQLITNGSTVARFLGSFASKEVQGVVGLLIFVAALFLPFYLGLLGSICCWALLLSFSVKSCRSVGFVAGAVVLIWAVMIPITTKVGYGVELQAHQVMEDVATLSSFTPAGEEFLAEKLEQSPNDPVLLFATGVAYQLKGLFAESRELYERALASGQADRTLETSIQMNIAVLNHIDGQFEEASKVYSDLESRGYKSFGLYYNQSLVSLAMLDTKGHATYYKKARNFDSAGLADVEAIVGDEPRPLISKPPFSFYSPIIFNAGPEAQVELLAKMKTREEAFAHSLMRNGSVRNLYILGSVILLLGLFAFRKANSKRSLRRAHSMQDKAMRETLVWVVLPAGLFMAGRRPLIGAGLVALLLCILFVQTEAPIRFFGGMPVDFGFNRLSVVLALTFIVGVTLYSIFLRTRDRKLVGEVL